MMDLRIRELMDELVERGHVDAIDMSIISQLMAVCMTGQHPDAAATQARRAKDRERKRVSVENSAEAPIISLDINPEGGVGETKTEIPRKHLEPVVGPELAAALVEHRKKLRAPLTAFAAQKLAKALKRCPNPKVAAEKMLERGWKGIDPEWLKNGKDPPNVLAYTPRPAPRPYREIKAELEAAKNDRG